MSDLLRDLTRAKVAFQLWTITAAMGIEPTEIECDICGDSHPSDNVPYPCETGDGV